MTKDQNKVFLIIGIAAIAFSVFGFRSSHKSNLSPAVHISYMDPEYAADFSDDKVLVGASHNIFVGKVVEQVSKKERGIGPETQFSVEVIENIKGELKDTVVVDQEGGYKNGILYLIGEEDSASNKKSYLLQPGSTYLFATRYNEKDNWYTINSFPTARKLISSDVSDSAQLKTLALEDSRVQELKEAYKNEILLDADVKNNNTLNSYESVQEKAALQAKETPPVEEEKPDTTTPNPIVSPDTQPEDAGSTITSPAADDTSISNDAN